MQETTARQISARNPVKGGIYIHTQGGGGISAEHRNFRTRQETTRQIRLIDAQGNEQFINKLGRMNITRQQSVLLCLEKRALLYRKDRPTLEQMDEVIYQEALDETGTVSIASLM